MNHNPDPVFDRLADTFRRLWWLVLVVTILFGAAFLIWSEKTRVSGSADISIADTSSSLSTVLLPNDLLDRAISLNVEARFLSTDEVRESVERSIGSKIDSSVAVQGNNILAIAVTGPSTSAVDRALDAYTALFRERRKTQLLAGVDSVEASLASQRQLNESRIEQLDQEIAAVPPDQQALLSAYLLERSERQDTLTDINAQATAVDSYVAGLDEGVRVVTRPATVTLLGRAQSGTVGLVLGAIIGCALVAVTSLIERRVRSHGDVTAATTTRYLGSVTKDQQLAATDLRRLASVIGANVDSRLLIVQLAGAANSAGALMAAVQDRLPELSVTSTDFDDVSTIGIAEEHASILLLTRWGSTGRHDLVAASRYFESVHRVPLGVVVVDVPKYAIRSMR